MSAGPVLQVNWITTGAPPCGKLMVQLRDAGEGSVLPARSVARTSKAWLPSASPVNDLGESHGAAAPSSSLHLVVALGSLTEKSICAVDAFVIGSGPLFTVTFGALRSTLQENAAGCEWFPASSAALTRNSCVPAPTV